MRRGIIAGLLLGGLVLSSIPGGATPPAERDPVELLVGHANRYVPKEAGYEEHLSLLFGPYHIPAGHDSNRITLDLPPLTGFVTAVAPELVDAATGRIPTEQEAHIHHAHWFRVDTEGKHEPYTAVGPASLSWVFGTGEEKSQGLFHHRWDMETDGPMYGMPVEAGTPNVLIYMIHNKLSTPLNVYVVLDVRFVQGDRESIQAATGRDIRPIEGTLWGETRTASANYPQLTSRYTVTHSGTIIAMGSHLHPGGKYTVVANLGPGGQCTADLDGDGFPGVTILNSQKWDRIPAADVYSENYQMGSSKFGWRAQVREGDHLVQYAPYAIYPDVDAVPQEMPSSLRREGFDDAHWDWMLANDPERYVSADGEPHAWYQAMTYSGIYVDREAAPIAHPEDPCTKANLAPTLLGDDTFEAQSRAGIVENTRGPLEIVPPAGSDMTPDEWIDAIFASRFEEGINRGMINHAWIGEPEPLCGLGEVGAAGGSAWPEWNPLWEIGCEDPANVTWIRPDGPGIETDTIHAAGFLYVPGGMGLPGELGAPARVRKGTNLTVYNEDAFVNIRHTLTTCPAPCSGRYQANYPLPDGVFDTNKMGNLDPIDGGFSGNWEPIQTYNTADFDEGLYTYFCRIHPWMRGAFEIFE